MSTSSVFTVYFYDALTGYPLSPLPVQQLKFSSTLNQPKQLSGMVNPTDPRMVGLDVWGATRPGRTVVAMTRTG